jgi:hypothetical protein
MSESNCPHSDSNFAHARTLFTEALAHVPEGVARKIAEDNARKLFNFLRGCPGASSTRRGAG